MRYHPDTGNRVLIPRRRLADYLGKLAVKEVASGIQEETMEIGLSSSIWEMEIGLSSSIWEKN